MVPLAGTKVLPSFPFPLTPPVLETAKVYVWQRFALGFYHQERTGRCWQEADIIGYISERGRVLQMEITREAKRKDKKEKERRKRHTQGGRELEGWAPESLGGTWAGREGSKSGTADLGTSRDFSMWLRLLPAGWPCSEWAYPKGELWRVSAPNDPEGGHMPLDDLVPEDPTGPFLRSLLAEATPSPSRFSGWGRRAHLTRMIISTFLVSS